jgi:hypothetical protein
MDSIHFQENNITEFLHTTEFTENTLKMRAFWDVASCSLVGVDRRFRGAYYIHHQGDEMSLCSNETTWRCVP